MMIMVILLRLYFRRVVSCRYDLAEMHFYFTFIDTIICTVMPSLLITVVNSLAVYRYRQCMRIYSSGVLRVRFLKVSDRDTPDQHLQVPFALFH